MASPDLSGCDAMMKCSQLEFAVQVAKYHFQIEQPEPIGDDERAGKLNGRGQLVDGNLLN